MAPTHIFFEKIFFFFNWPSKNGYRQLRRPKSLPRMRFSSLCDASPPRNINVCVFDLDLGRKTTSRGAGEQFFLDSESRVAVGQAIYDMEARTA